MDRHRGVGHHLFGHAAEIGALLGNAVIDIEYTYGSSAGTGRALLVFKTNNIKKSFDTLK